jgi:ribosomal peptide maturation radical SAM protein 1
MRRPFWGGTRKLETETDLCIVVPAFDTLNLTPLGTSVLIAACRQRGFRVGAVYASVLMGARIGYELYETICGTLVRKQPGEYIFKPHAYPPETLARIPEGIEHPKMLDLIASVAPAVGPHLDEVVEAIAAKKPRIVGITNMFQQNMSAFAIARRVRAALPDALIVMGGANVTGVMAKALAQIFDCVDYFFDGEADVAFPDFCEAYLRRGERPAERVVECVPLQNMADSPDADFSDFIAALREQQDAGRLPPELPGYVTYESSRGCWWGAKHHCIFCGLNQASMNFREKGSERVVRELTALDERWDGRPIRTADNIIPNSYFATVLPQLAAMPRPPKLFYEVKANLKEEQVALMRTAGVYSIQPGVESLSTPVLKLMRKGVSAHQNIMLLRSSAKHGMRAGWNLIYGFPGETQQNYRDMLAIFPALVHFRPPDGISEIMIDRFSPNFDDHERLGIPEIKPFEIYRGLYPSDAPLDEIAYHFDGIYTTEFLSDTALVKEFRDSVDHWKRLWLRPQRPLLLLETKASGGGVVIDTRPIAREALSVLSPGVVNALAQLERPRPREGLPEAVAEHLDFLLQRRYVIDHENLLLSVVVRRASAEPNRARVPMMADASPA